ncbi:MAG: DUF1295 domain-containing protein [Bdellovibrionales bacterium]|nr:DUF1295 domain-containing protein [Bdellovibrionales bacterium]
MDFSLSIVAAVVLMLVVMSVTWLLAKRWDNYSIVDAAWAGSFAIIALFFALTQPGLLLRKTLMLFAVGIWSLRLAIFLTRRIRSHHPVEDSRYQQLRAEYGKHAPARFFLFFQYQALSVVLLAIPFLEVFRSDIGSLSGVEIAGFLLICLSLIGESIADAQAQKFKQNPENKNKTCQVGLWRYSRHPNYFFESCVWWGFYLFAIGAAGAYYTVYAPLIILFLLLKVTGVPPSEAAALKKRGEEYRRYQQTTSMFVPWFPKKDPH